jgi:hypothetical protein
VDTYGGGIALQLSTTGSDLSALAAWAEHLGTAVDVWPSDGQFSLRVEITTTSPDDRSITLWNYLEDTDRQALETTFGHPIESWLAMSSAVVHRAAALTTSESTPGGESA